MAHGSLPTALALAAIAASAFALLLSGHPANEYPLPGGLPLGNLLVATGGVAIAAAAWALHPAPRGLARAALLAALAWLPLSVLLAGNLALNFRDGRGSAWLALSLATAAVCVASLVAAVFRHAQWRWTRLPDRG